MHTGSFRGSLLAPAVAGGNCKHTWSGGDQGRQQGLGPTVYAWLVGALPWLLGLTTSMWQWGPPGIGLRAHRYTFGGVRCRLSALVQASDRRQSLIQALKQLHGPRLLARSALAAQSPHGHPYNSEVW